MQEIITSVFNNELAMEMTTIIFIGFLFIVGSFFNKWLKKMGIEGYGNVVKMFFSILTTRAMKPIAEKDKEFETLNKEIQKTMSEDAFGEKKVEEEKKDVNAN